MREVGSYMRRWQCGVKAVSFGFKHADHFPIKNPTGGALSGGFSGC